MRSAIDAGTVLITDASSELGQELARQLSRRARTLVLVAHREDQLEALREELLLHNPTLGVVVEPCDLSRPEAVLALLETLQRDLVRVDVLVNLAYPGDPGLYEEEPWERIHQAMQEGLTAPLLLTHRLVRRMVKRRWGGLLHIEVGGVRPFAPGRAVRAATQRFLEEFTESLRLELWGTGVVVTQVMPGPVEAATAGAEEAPAWLRISAARCAREAIAGFDGAEPRVVPGWTYRWLSRLSSLLPRGVRRAAHLGAVRRLRAGPELAHPSPETAMGEGSARGLLTTSS